MEVAKRKLTEIGLDNSNGVCMLTAIQIQLPEYRQIPTELWLDYVQMVDTGEADIPDLFARINKSIYGIREPLSFGFKVIESEAMLKDSLQLSRGKMVIVTLGHDIYIHDVALIRRWNRDGSLKSMRTVDVLMETDIRRRDYVGLHTYDRLWQKMYKLSEEEIESKNQYNMIELPIPSDRN